MGEDVVICGEVNEGEREYEGVVVFVVVVVNFNKGESVVATDEDTSNRRSDLLAVERLFPRVAVFDRECALALSWDCGCTPMSVCEPVLWLTSEGRLRDEGWDCCDECVAMAL